MVGIAVLTMVASMAKRKITSMTPITARLRFELSVWVVCWDEATLLGSGARRFCFPHELSEFAPGVKELRQDSRTCLVLTAARHRRYTNRVKSWRDGCSKE